MTMPDERYRAIERAREFLRDLLDPKKTPKVPRHVRQQAYCVLKHFPGEFDMFVSREKVPKIWGQYNED